MHKSAGGREFALVPAWRAHGCAATDAEGGQVLIGRLPVMARELPSTRGNFGSPVRASGQSGTTGPVWEWSTTIEKEDDMMGEPIHSGNELCENLDVLGMSAADLCRRIEVPVSRITELLNVRRAVTGNTALRPGRVFGT